MYLLFQPNFIFRNIASQFDAFIVDVHLKFLLILKIFLVNNYLFFSSADNLSAKLDLK